MAAPTFYFDLGSPYAYLAAVRLNDVLSRPVQWQPVLLGGLSSWRAAARGRSATIRRRQVGMAEIEKRARSYGLPPIVWPDPWAGDYLFAMRVATYALTVGRIQAFAAAAFEVAFQHGRRLDFPAHVLAAAGRAGLDRDQAEAATHDPAIKRALREATDAAYARGVLGVPTIAVGEQCFWGDDRLGDAAAQLRGMASAGR